MDIDKILETKEKSMNQNRTKKLKMIKSLIGRLFKKPLEPDEIITKKSGIPFSYKNVTPRSVGIHVSETSVGELLERELY